MSLRVRMGLASGVAVAVAVIAVAFTAYAGTGSELHGQLDQSLRNLYGQALPPAGSQSGTSLFGPLGLGGQGGGAGNAAGGQSGRFSAGDHDEGLGLDRRNGPPFGGPSGVLRLVYANGGSWEPTGQQYSIPVTSQLKAFAARGTGREFVDMTVSGTSIRVMATGLGRYGALLIALPLTDVNKTLSSELLLLVIVAAAGIALAALLGILVARTALSPIARFTRQTEEIAAQPDRLGEQRLEVRGADELARLAQTFNGTLDALERSVQSQRNLVADASHELRTPISTIRANLQLMRDEEMLSPEDREALRSDVIEELDELTALVGDVVELARGTKQDGEPGDVRLDSVVAAAVERTRRRAPELTVEAHLEPTLVHGEGDRIARAVNNLLDNAVKYGSGGKVIEVELHDGILVVRDHGRGFHDEDLAFVFDRFHRARDARGKPGSGLGLAIVRQAAEAHGGTVEAANAEGGGARMTITFGPAQTIEEMPERDRVSPS